MLLKKVLCLFSIVCFSLIAFYSFAGKEEPPKNRLVFSHVFENVVDNSWSNLDFPKDEQPPGLYYIEMTEKTGEAIGCWGSKKDPYEDGPEEELLCAWQDGEPLQNKEADFRLQYRPTKGAWVELIVVAPQGAIGDTWNPFGLHEAKESIGQTFIALEEFTGVGLHTPTWNTNISGCTMSLYSAEAEEQAVEPGGKLTVEWGKIKADSY